jgi:hypothetical protein
VESINVGEEEKRENGRWEETTEDINKYGNIR